jgi:hypothetical protein
MAYPVLIEFVDRDKFFRSQLSSEQIKSVREWAQRVPVSEQLGHRSCLMKLYGEGLQIYLSSIIPEFYAKEN